MFKSVHRIDIKIEKFILNIRDIDIPKDYEGKSEQK